jgi:uncharacterized protein (TIGR03435 family)
VKTLLVTIALGMQLHANDRVQFETAAVKTDQCTFESRKLGPGSVVLKGLPLKPILMAAFAVESDQIIGPSWLESDCFDILATLPQGSTNEQIPQMLQALFADRFKLSSHKEGRPKTGYTLVVDKNGPKLKESKEGSTFMAGRPAGTKAVRRGGGGFKGVMTMEELAKSLSRQVDGPVVDATGLKGEYEVDLSWSATSAAAESATTPASDLFYAVRASLGLRLEPRKTQVDVLVIDHIDRVPTEN